MKYMLDANTCIYIINKRPPNVAETFAQHDLNDICISSIVVGELSYGVSKSISLRSKVVLEQFLEPITLLDFDVAAAQRFGELRAALERKGTPIGPFDMQIAAHALSLGATLVSNNLKEFRKVKGLKLENWFG
jgi:tRNA(fMet)-specific endonuclease VapC